MVGEALNRLVELLAVLLAEIDLIVPAIETERASQLLAVGNFL
jgi:hypothetical protein